MLLAHHTDGLPCESLPVRLKRRETQYSDSVPRLGTTLD